MFIPCNASTPLAGVLCTIAGLLNYVIPILITLGAVYFVWGVVQYVIGDGEEAKKKGKNHIIMGIIGLAVILAMWGLVRIVVVTFGLGRSNYAPSSDELRGMLPQLPNQ